MAEQNPPAQDRLGYLLKIAALCGDTACITADQLPAAKRMIAETGILTDLFVIGTGNTAAIPAPDHRHDADAAHGQVPAPYDLVVDDRHGRTPPQPHHFRRKHLSFLPE